MSFNVGGSSGSLSFRPARYDVEWDGVSEAKASFALACQETGVSYAAKAYHVFEEDVSLVCGNNNPVEGFRGERRFTLDCPANVRVFASDITLPSTVSGGAVSITFSAITATTNVYAWQLTATKGTATRIVIAGKLQAVGLNPYAPGAGRISLVSGVTASGCL